jgi:hypothetical protein
MKSTLHTSVRSNVDTDTLLTCMQSDGATPIQPNTRRIEQRATSNDDDSHGESTNHLEGIESNVSAKKRGLTTREGEMPARRSFVIN